MDEMMHGRYQAAPSVLLTTPALDDGNADLDTPMEDTPMDLCLDHTQDLTADVFNAPEHGRRVPPMHDLMEESGRGATPMASASQPLQGLSPGLSDALGRDLPAPQTPSPNAKRRRTGGDHARDTLAE